MFENLSTDDIVRIAMSGASFSTQAGMRTTPDLLRIALAAAKTGARITFKGLAARTTEELIQIGLAGKGVVKFSD